MEVTPMSISNDSSSDLDKKLDEVLNNQETSQEELDKKEGDMTE